MTGLFSFKGRIDRAGYLAVTIPLAFIFLVWVGWWLYAISLADTDSTVRVLRLSAFGWLVCAWPYFAAGVKRCHDRGRSGLWYVCWTAGCLACWIAGVIWQSWYAAHAGNLVALWTLIEMGGLRGEADANRFGPLPAS